MSRPEVDCGYLGRAYNNGRRTTSCSARCLLLRFPFCHHCITASRVRMGRTRPELASCQSYSRAHGHRSVVQTFWKLIEDE